MIRLEEMSNRELYGALMRLSASLPCPGEPNCGNDTCERRKMEELTDEIASRLLAKDATL